MKKSVYKDLFSASVRDILRVQDHVHVLDTPGLDVERLVKHVSCDDGSVLNLSRVDARSCMTEELVLVVPPMSKEECAEIIGVEVTHPQVQTLRWLVSLHPLIMSMFSVHGEGFLDFRENQSHQLVRHLIERMEAWLEPLSTELVEAASLLAFGPVQVRMSDMEGVLERGTFYMLTQAGLGVMDGLMFELHPLARHVLLERIDLNKKQIHINRICDLIFDVHKLERWPDSLLSDFDYSQFCRRQIPFLKSLLEGVEPQTCVKWPSVARDVFHAYALLGYTSNTEGVDSEEVDVHRRLVEEVSEGEPSHAALVMLESFLTNYGRHFEPEYTQMLLDKAFEWAGALDAAHVLVYLKVLKSKYLYKNGFFKESNDLMSHIFYHSGSPVARVMVSANLARLQTDYKKRLEVEEEALRISLEHRLIYGEFVARAEQVYRALKKGEGELAMVQLKLLDELVEREDVGLRTRVDLHLLHAMYWQSVPDLSETVRCYEEAEALLDELGLIFERGVVHFNLGRAYLKHESFDLAYKHFDFGHRYFVQANHLRDEYKAEAWKIYTLLRNSQHLDVQEHSYYDSATRVLEKLDVLPEEQRNTQVIQEIYGLLERALEDDKRRLKVASDGSFFRTLGGEEISLEHRRVLQDVLAALVQFDGVASVDDIIQQAWPDEKMTLTSGKNRVRVAISTLRKLGMKAAISYSNEQRGYTLDADVISR